MSDASVQTCVTSPPYWGLRDYGVAGQIGLEPTPDAYVAALVDVFKEVRRVLREDGTLWLNLGDSYVGGKTNSDADKAEGGHWSNRNQRRDRIAAGFKRKDLVGIPWRVAFALQAGGWWLRSEIIWNKPNAMPESVADRPTRTHEYIFLLTRSETYFYDGDAIKEPLASDPDTWGRHSKKDPGLAATNPRPMFGPGRDGRDGSEWGDGFTRNRRSVWTVPTAPFPEAHFATFPPDLIKPCILAGSRPGDTVLDPFAGAGTTLYVAKELNRGAIGIELNPVYVALAEKRLRQEVLPL